MNTARATQEELYEKVLTRDPQYDDVFFFAVTSTGIYCRPSCPARRPLKKNCTFFSSARDAEKSGFRACKRCRPNQAKTDTIILQLHNVRSDRLTDTERTRAAIGVDIGERQVRRMLKNTIGKTPTQLFQKQRLNYAHDLLQHTKLRIIDIAFRAGFNSVRQFNHAFKQEYGISPSQGRKGERLE